MELRLNALRIENFKGLRHFEIAPHGSDYSIGGDNGTGKTTIYDAFLWLLFGKDSTGRTDFEFKPLLPDGSTAHNLLTCVQADITLDGAPHAIEKRSEEKWVKPRGRDAAEYAGNLSSFLIDGVPRKANEWKTFISEIVSEDTFRLMTNWATFNNMPWQKRREALLALLDTDPAATLIGQPRFAEIPAILNGQTPEDAKKRLMLEKRKLAEDLDRIPARIDELQRSLPTATEDDYAQNERTSAELTAKIADIDAQIAAAAQTDPELARAEKLAALQRERKTLICNAQQRAQGHISTLQTNFDVAQRMLRQIEQERDAAETTLCRTRDARDQLAAERENLLKQYRDADAEEYAEPAIDTVCPTCGQPLPADKIDSARQQARAKWEKEHGEWLAQILARGTRVKTELAGYDERALVSETTLSKLAPQLKAQAEKVISAQAELERATRDYSETGGLDQSESQSLNELEARITALNAQTGNNSTDVVKTLRSERGTLSGQLQACNTFALQKSAAAKTNSRINELREENAALGKQIARRDRQIMLVEAFTAARCQLLEESINAMFPTVRWRLFTTQINGGMADDCTCTVNGVPFTDLNNAARINAGLEIIAVLAARYEVNVPVFVDNAEAVNRLAPIGTQLIRLVVTLDKQLTELDADAALQTA